jgi:hypothetical protein
MVSSGGNIIIWCYHVILSSGMITHPFFIFPENFTHSLAPAIRLSELIPSGLLIGGNASVGRLMD